MPEPQPVNDEELIHRLGFLYSPDQVGRIALWIKQAREDGGDEAAELIKARYTCRMHELSEFVKTLKQKYTQWHNKRHNREGTLWSQRFKSIMIEPKRAKAGQWNNALLTMAAYIVKRRKGARPLRNADFGGLCTMRDLRRAAITPSKAA